jgi:hypothetical protein
MRKSTCHKGKCFFYGNKRKPLPRGGEEEVSDLWVVCLYDNDNLYHLKSQSLNKKIISFVPLFFVGFG